MGVLLQSGSKTAVLTLEKARPLHVQRKQSK